MNPVSVFSSIEIDASLVPVVELVAADSDDRGVDELATTELLSELALFAAILDELFAADSLSEFVRAMLVDLARAKLSELALCLELALILLSDAARSFFFLAAMILLDFELVLLDLEVVFPQAASVNDASSVAAMINPFFIISPPSNIPYIIIIIQILEFNISHNWIIFHICETV